MSMMNLTEATMLALQGKLNLEESIVNKNQKLQKDLAKTVSTKNRKSYKTEKRALKKEDISVAVDDTTSVSVSDTETVVNTADAQIIITEPNTNSEELSISASDNSVELPITGDDTIMPEEITELPVDTELPAEEPSLDEIVNDDVSLEAPDGLESEEDEDKEHKEDDEEEDEDEEDENDEDDEDENDEDDEKNESKIVEDTEEYLQPRFDSRSSFYKKAKVVTKDNGDEELYSYGTLVGGIKDGKPYSTGKWSQTTTRHQKEYFKQRGFDPDKVEVTETKKSNKKSDKTFKEFVEAKNKKIEQKDKFSSKTFNKVLTDYFKSKDKAVESVSVTSMFKNNDTMKLEAKLTKVRGTSRDICLEMRKVQSGKSFNKFELTEAKGLKRESKNRSSKVTMMTFTNKQNVLECRYIISK